MNEQQIVDTLEKIVAPTPSQDPLDLQAGELYVANIIRKYGTSRYDAIKKTISKTIDQKIEDVQTSARDLKMKCEATAQTANFVVTVSAASPATRVDADAFRVALIKAGVKQKIVDDAYASAVKYNNPATSINSVPVE